MNQHWIPWVFATTHLNAIDVPLAACMQAWPP